MVDEPSPRASRGEVKASCRVDADADRAGHAGAAETAIARRVLGEILLMIVLGEIERTRGCDLRGDRAEPLCRQRLLIGRLRFLSGLLLRVAERVDRRAILRADVVALAHALGRVVVFPEHLQQLFVSDLLRIEHDQHHFGVAGTARADLFIGRVRREAAGIADRRREDALAELPELSLRAPETAEREHGLFEALRIRRQQIMAVDEMARGRGDWRSAARQGLARAWQRGGLAHEKHGLPPGGTFGRGYSRLTGKAQTASAA